MQVSLCDGELRREGLGLLLLVALHDVVDVDVPPAALLLVHDLDGREFAGEIGHVPGVPVEVFGAAGLVVGAGRGADHFAGDEQVDARLAFVLAAADQKVEVVAFEFEFGTRERAGGFVATEEAVDEPFTLESGDDHLAWECPLCGPFAEGGSRGGPP